MSPSYCGDVAVGGGAARDGAVESSSNGFVGRAMGGRGPSSSKGFDISDLRFVSSVGRPAVRPAGAWSLSLLETRDEETETGLRYVSVIRNRALQ